MRVWLKVRILTVYGRQNKFAKLIGKPDVWLSRVINNKAEPTESEKKFIAGKLGVEDVESLFVK